MPESPARELLALRAYLVTALDPSDVTRLGMNTIATAAAPAFARGWTGQELASLAVAGVYDGTIENPSAYIVANLRDLGTQDPPREITPGPPPVAEVLAEMHGRHTPSTNPNHWANKIRQTPTNPPTRRTS